MACAFSNVPSALRSTVMPVARRRWRGAQVQVDVKRRGVVLDYAADIDAVHRGNEEIANAACSTQHSKAVSVV